MTTRESYLQAEFPKQFRVLGWRLHELTLGHMLLLEWADSPFVTVGEPGLGDCAFALAICTRNFRRARKLINSRFSKWRIKRFTVPTYFFEQTVSQLCRYFEHFSVCPKCWSKDADGGRSRGTPFYEAVKITLIARLHKTANEALETPLSLALHDYAAFWELEDRLSLSGEHEEAAMALAKEMANERV